MPSTSVEDYLKTIYALQEKESIAKTGALAENLGISSGSVSEMLKRMAGMSPPLIDYRQHHGATLTRQGRLKAMAVIRRHRLLETFLYRILKLDWDSVHEEAETLEHHLSERVVHAMDALLSHPKRDPHGEPIPDGSGVMSSPIGEKLTFLNPGEKFRIVRVDPGMDGILTYLDTLGLGIDSIGKVVSQSPVDETISLQIITDRGSHGTVIGLKAAEHIYVLPD
ncbi:MAG: metal-dependent transcriptional regulator [Desulfobacterales bacterium]|jgi:DtxR family Mn-dependent transcriptional regulator